MDCRRAIPKTTRVLRNNNFHFEFENLSLKKMLDSVSLRLKFISSDLDHLCGVIINFETFDKFVTSVVTGHWIREHKTIWYTICTIELVTDNTHATPCTFRSLNPITHVVQSGVSSTCSARGSSSLNYCSSTLLNCLEELTLYPCIINESTDWLSFNSGVVEVWVHCA